MFTAYIEPLIAVAEATFGLTIADLSGDGRSDVLTDGGRRLLLGSPAGFVDASATHMPAHVAGTCCSIDADADGDLDVAGSRFLLVNDGTGRFADVTATGYQPAPTNRVLLATGDFDGDGDADVVALATWFLGPLSPVVFPPLLLANRHRHLGAANDPVRGQPFPIDLVAAPGYGTAPTAAVPFLALQPAGIPIRDLGCVGLQPSTMTALPVLVAIPSPAGLASVALPIPNLPQLANLPIYLQALCIEPSLELRLTNAIEARIQ